MQAQEIHAAIRTVKREIARWPDPVVGVVARQSGRDPFLVLISCLLSLRTKDKTTAEASERLFALAVTPATMQTLTIPVIERAIYPAGFYRTKAKQIQQICAQLLERYQGRVPDKIDELLTLPGVGRKTANLVVTVGYEKPGFVSIFTSTGSATAGGTSRPRVPMRQKRPFAPSFPASIGSHSTTCWCPTDSTSASRSRRCAASARLRRIAIVSA
jgi:hypothetical protein